MQPFRRRVHPSSRSYILMWLFYLGVSALFVFLKWRIFHLDQPRIFFDTTSYALTADMPIFSRAFWASSRPITIPLFYKLFGLRGEVYTIAEPAFIRFTYFQGVISTISWVSLAAVLASALRALWLRLIAYPLVLFFAASVDVSQWDRMLLSESLSFSLLALFLACLIGYLSSWESFEGWPMVVRLLFAAGFLLITGLYSLTRDLNAFFVLVTGLTLIGWAIYRRSPDIATQWIRLGIGFLMLIVFAAQTYTAARGYRWFGPFRNIFYARILENERAVGYFLEEGLPLKDEEIEDLRGLDREDFMDYLEAPGAERTFLWLRSEGRSVYLSYLLTVPLETATAPFTEFRHMISPDSTEYRNPVVSTPAWLIFISRVAHPDSLILTVLLLLIPVLLLAGWSVSNKAIIDWWLAPAVLVLAIYPLMFVVYHGDAIELERHAAQIALQSRLAAWMFILAVLEVIAMEPEARDLALEHERQ